MTVMREEDLLWAEMVHQVTLCLQRRRVDEAHAKAVEARRLADKKHDPGHEMVVASEILLASVKALGADLHDAVRPLRNARGLADTLLDPNLRELFMGAASCALAGVLMQEKNFGDAELLLNKVGEFMASNVQLASCDYGAVKLAAAEIRCARGEWDKTTPVYEALVTQLDKEDPVPAEIENLIEVLARLGLARYRQHNLPAAAAMFEDMLHLMEGAGCSSPIAAMACNAMSAIRAAEGERLAQMIGAIESAYPHHCFRFALRVVSSYACLIAGAPQPCEMPVEAVQEALSQTTPAPAPDGLRSPEPDPQRAEDKSAFPLEEPPEKRAEVEGGATVSGKDISEFKALFQAANLIAERGEHSVAVQVLEAGLEVLSRDYGCPAGGEIVFSQLLVPLYEQLGFLEKASRARRRAIELRKLTAKGG